MYVTRLIDTYLTHWAKQSNRKPLLLRGARQVGKSSAIRHLGEQFENYVEINFEKQPKYQKVFKLDLDVHRICSQLEALSQQPIVAGKTLLFLDEIQECPQAIMSLRFFKEDYPDLHVAAAGSLLEFALAELPTFGVGRIHSMFMYPMTFDEFLMATDNQRLMLAKQKANSTNPLAEPLHDRLVELFRTYLLVGGMPEVVCCWAQTHEYLRCQQLQDEIVLSYEDDFAKYKKNITPDLLRQVLHGVAVQITKKFVCAKVMNDIKADKIREAVRLLTMAGLTIPVTRTSANGLPLGGEADFNYQKMLILDSGLLLRLLNFSLDNATAMSQSILTDSATDLVNKGPVSEMVAGLELLRYQDPTLKRELFYWVGETKNSMAEVDYVQPYNAQILPIEIKAEAQGGMKSLWLMMRKKNLSSAIRCSLENFGHLNYVDTYENNVVRQVSILPLYAIANIFGAKI